MLAYFSHDGDAGIWPPSLQIVLGLSQSHERLLEMVNRIIDEKENTVFWYVMEESNTGGQLSAVHVADSQNTMVQCRTVHWPDWTRLAWLIFSHVLLWPRSWRLFIPTKHNNSQFYFLLPLFLWLNVWYCADACLFEIKAAFPFDENR